MATFRKYEFTPAQWATAKSKIQTTNEEGEPTWDATKVVAVVELGFICLERNEEGECVSASPLYAVDILWANEPLEDFSEFVVWPAPVGIHVFAGWESQYAIDYCESNPEAEYCQPPLPPTEL